MGKEAIQKGNERKRQREKRVKGKEEKRREKKLYGK